MAQGLYISQQLRQLQVLAPQLQQSLALLQAPTLELKALVEQELQQNPVLEELAENETSTEENDRSADASMDLAEPPADLSVDPATEKESGEPVDDWQAEFEKLSQIDQEWRDYFSQTAIPMKASQEDEEKRQFMFDSLVTNTSLQESLREQIRLSNLEEELWQIADLIIGNIDDHGYLKAKIDELAFSTNTPAETIQEVLSAIQSFDPPGVGARDLRECLMLQLERAKKTDTLEYRILDQCFAALGKRRMPEIARDLGVSVDLVQQAAERIAHLDPRPGSDFLPDNQQYVVPEVFVTKDDSGEFVVSTNNDHIPHLRISNVYKDLMAQAESSADVREYIRDKIRSGKFLIKSIHQRQTTITNIAKQIIQRQREFFEHGVSHLKPLTMIQIAEAVGVHETTVSRAVSGKYMQCPQGIFEMKFFFTSGIQTASGQNVSNTSVKDMIAEMVKHEDPAKPFSDEEIVRQLKDKEIVIARRTVAKYRSELNILPSHLRKVY